MQVRLRADTVGFVHCDANELVAGTHLLEHIDELRHLETLGSHVEKPIWTGSSSETHEDGAVLRRCL